MVKTIRTLGAIAGLAVLGSCASSLHSDRGNHYANPEFFTRGTEIDGSIYTYTESNGGKHKELLQVVIGDGSRIVYHDHIPSVSDKRFFTLDSMVIKRPGQTKPSIINRDSNYPKVEKTLADAQIHVDNIFEIVYERNTRPFYSPAEPVMGPPPPN